MAGSSLLSLLDDIATLLDDVSVMSKVAVKKTAGVLGDDLALNAEQVAGVLSNRELPVVWAVAKGSILNKAILVPSALLISFFIPDAITPLLMIGGLFLCYEGFEKILHKLMPHNEVSEHLHHKAQIKALVDKKIDILALEKEKIRGAVRTDFILSAEIIVISLGTLKEAAFHTQVLTLCVVAILMTIGVYGLVAAIVKMDDIGLVLVARAKGSSLDHRFQKYFGSILITLAPRLMKFLTIAGTAAMFLVGGGILTHGLSIVHHGIAELTAILIEHSIYGKAVIEVVAGLVFEALLGIIAGMCVFLFLKILSFLKRLWMRKNLME